MTYYDLPKRDQEIYRDLDLEAKNHPLEASKEASGNAKYWFKPNLAVAFIVVQHHGCEGLNELSRAVQTGLVPQKDARSFYRQMGYSLAGYLEVFERPE